MIGLQPLCGSVVVGGSSNVQKESGMYLNVCTGQRKPSDAV